MLKEIQKCYRSVLKTIRWQRVTKSTVVEAVPERIEKWLYFEKHSRKTNSLKQNKKTQNGRWNAKN